LAATEEQNVAQLNANKEIDNESQELIHKKKEFKGL
jgi:hypothetical protein